MCFGAKSQNITGELCGEEFSKSTVPAPCKKLDPAVTGFQDHPLESHYPFLIVNAAHPKVRIDHRVQSRKFLIAVVIYKGGHRETIPFQLTTTESENS